MEGAVSLAEGTSWIKALRQEGHWRAFTGWEQIGAAGIWWVVGHWSELEKPVRRPLQKHGREVVALDFQWWQGKWREVYGCGRQEMESSVLSDRLMQEARERKVSKRTSWFLAWATWWVVVPHNELRALNSHFSCCIFFLANSIFLELQSKTYVQLSTGTIPKAPP